MKWNTKKKTVLRKIYTGNDARVDEYLSVFQKKIFSSFFVIILFFHIYSFLFVFFFLEKPQQPQHQIYYSI